jgi:acetyltransferase-like isoleucine patch superfamily enzyme
MILTTEHLSKLKAKGLDFYGSNRPIADDFCFEPPCSIKFTIIEQGCSLGAFSYIVSGYLCGVAIGRYCSFGENIQIGRQNHPMHWLSTSPFLYLNNKDILAIDPKFDENILTEVPIYPEPATQLKKTIIKNDVWVGHGAIINAGITIENGAVIAAGSVVTKDVPAYAIVGGNPAKLIRYRFSADVIEQLQKYQWWQYSPEQIKNLPLHDMNLIAAQFEELTSTMVAHTSETISIQDLLLNPDASKSN